MSKVGNVLNQFPSCLETLRQTPLNPNLNLGDKTKLIHFINEEKTKQDIGKLKALYGKN